jgi:hypothetical protein
MVFNNLCKPWILMLAGDVTPFRDFGGALLFHQKGWRYSRVPEARLAVFPPELLTKTTSPP